MQPTWIPNFQKFNKFEKNYSYKTKKKNLFRNCFELSQRMILLI